MALVCGLAVVVALPRFIPPKPSAPVLLIDCRERLPQCVGDVGGHAIYLTLEDPFLPLERLHWQVGLHHSHASEGSDGETFTLISAIFEGDNMDMGQHPLRIVSQDAQRARLNGVIPICSVNANMEWRLTMVLETSGQPYRVHWLLGGAHEAGNVSEREDRT